MIRIFTNPNSQIYLLGVAGKQVLTPQDKGSPADYKQVRFRADNSPQNSVKYMNRQYSKIRYDEAWMKKTIKKLVNGVMAHPNVN